MKNISFDNPWLLLVAIPIVLAIVIPYAIAVSKDNKTLGWKISLGLHLAIGAAVSLALAGLMTTSVLTRTTVYVVADVSYSSERNLDEIDAYIAEIKEELPDNSRLGVVCFGKNVVVLTPEGRALKSVSEAKVDDTATDIAGALNYTGSLFRGETIKRIVLITDGNDTVSRDAGSIASVVEGLTDAGVKVDAIFLNNALQDGETEVQLSNAEYTESVYVEHENQLKMIVQASADTNIILKLHAREYGSSAEEDFEEVGYAVLTAEAGLNTVSMELPCDKPGVFEYKATLEAEKDTSLYTNSVSFVQTVEGKLRVLHVTGTSADRQAVESMYGDYAEVDSYLVSGANSNAPFILEELTAYDEIILSNLDIRNIRNVNAFVDSLDIVVSQYGKSLITMGDLSIQNDKSDPIFKKFAEILPVTYGSANKEGRLYTIVLDVSHSMFMAEKFTMAKEAAIKLLSVLEEDDYVCLVTFSGEIKSTPVDQLKRCKKELIEYINGLSTSHATDIGGGLNKALQEISAQERLGQVMLISDGLSVDNQYDALEITRKLEEKGVVVSAIDVYIPSTDPTGAGRSNMQQIARIGNGNFYQLSRVSEVDSVVFGSVADEVTNAIVQTDSAVHIVNYKDDIIDGFVAFPKVSTFIKSVKKYDAIMPLTVDCVEAISGVVPLYAYRQHGNGKVSSLTTSLAQSWTANWSESAKASFLENMLMSNTPRAKVDYPFNLKVESDEYETYVEVTPSILMPDAKVTVTMVDPNGIKTKKELFFDAQKYFYTFETGKVGAYSLTITYTYEDKEFTADDYFNISYLPEYNAYTSFDSAKIYEFMRGNGSINVGEIPSLENDRSEVSTYKVSFTIPLLIVAVVLFVLDIALRKLKVGDIRAARANRKRAKGGKQ